MRRETNFHPHKGVHISVKSTKRKIMLQRLIITSCEHETWIDHLSNHTAKHVVAKIEHFILKGLRQLELRCEDEKDNKYFASK